MKKWIIGAAVVVVAGVICMSGISKRLGGGDKDVVEAYYAELVNDNSELKKLEKEIAANKGNLYELEGRFNSYNRLSTDYYSDATNKANTIRDATLKTMVNEWVTNSRVQYGTRITELTRLLGMLRDKQITQTDYHLAVKIAMTLPMIEKYQRDNLPSDAEYQKLMKELDETIKKLQGMAKK
jgi:hypothetical protein